MRLPWRKKKYVTSAPFTLPPYGSATFIAAVPEKDLNGTVLRAVWECGGCGRKLVKSLPARYAAEYGFGIACPYCDPDEPISRDVEVQV